MIQTFSPYVAKHFGIPAAIIHQGLAFRCDRSPRGSVAASQGALAIEYPYLSQTVIHRALKSLCCGTKKCPSLLRRCIKRGELQFTYKIADELRELADLQRFDTEVAMEFGVLAAVVHYSIGFSVRSNWKSAADLFAKELDPADYGMDAVKLSDAAIYLTTDLAWHYTTPRHWAGEHGYVSVPTVKRAFAALLKAGLLRKKAGRERIPGWSIEEADPVYIKSMSTSGSAPGWGAKMDGFGSDARMDPSV